MRRTTKFFLFALSALLAAAPALAATATISDKLSDVVAAAKAEGAIDIVWSTSGYGDEDAAKAAVAATNKMFGTNLTYRFAPGNSMPEQGNKLFTEFKAGQTASSDLLISAPLALTELIDAGIFLDVPWTKLSHGRIPAALVEAKGQVVPINTGITEVTYNTDSMPKPPTDLAGLLAPEWKGKLATTPYGAGFDVLLATDFWGPDKTFGFLKRFLPQVAGLIRCGDDQRIASGEFTAFALECTSQAPILAKESGAPIDYFIPSDAAQLRYYYYAIPKNAGHPNAATLLGLYLLSREGQAAMWKDVRQDLDTLPGSESGKVVKSYEAKGVRFKAITADWWMQHPEIGQNMKQLLTLFSASK